MLGLIIAIVVVGFISGLIARALLPGNDSMSLMGTTFLGIIGSFVGGFLGYLLFNKDGGDGLLQPAGLIGSIIGAIIVLALVRSSSRTHTV